MHGERFQFQRGFRYSLMKDKVYTHKRYFTGHMNKRSISNRVRQNVSVPFVVSCNITAQHSHIGFKCISNRG
jgi:hypothetical protein